MVWIRIIFLVLIINFELLAEEPELFTQEYFDFMDMDKDGFISDKEINQITTIIFQLIDKNNDNKISTDEINELSEIIKIFK